MKSITLCLAALFVAGCGGYTPPVLCTPGQSISCVGVAGCSGGQVCNANGTSYGTCQCGSNGGGNGNGGGSSSNGGGQNANGGGTAQNGGGQSSTGGNTSTGGNSSTGGHDGNGGGTGGGSTDTTCSQSCFGCCDASGICQGGNANSHCGANGAACEICGSGHACQSNQCVPTTCSGCVSSTNTCFAGTSASACGAGGASCSVCKANETCVGGQCHGPSTTCSASCNGCCDNGSCIGQPTPEQCGAFGSACIKCNANETCGVFSGQCEAPNDGGTGAVCDANSCPNGCCDSIFNTCVPGTDGNACGSGGGTCLPCTLLSLQCINQMCG